jgi:peptidyl-prolyl cis-trans isomerase A (cyclophilin A)
MKAAWMCLGVYVATFVPACREPMHPDVEKQSTSAANTQLEAEKPAEKAPVAQQESAPKAADKPAVTNDGYEIVHAKKGDGENAEVAVKPPPGFQVATGAPDSKDPHAGKFTLEEALKDLPGKGKLHTTIRTSLGSFECQLFEDKAPTTVANFVGLARGLRKFWSPKDHAWVAKPYYDGTNFHRVIPEFMIQGGDWKGDGSGDMYYTIPDELHDSLKHDRGGLLCMANRGPNTNEAQFFITEAAAAHLDKSYTIFGECSPVDLVKKIARVPQSGPPLNRPLTPVVIEKVTVDRRAAGAAAPKAAAPAAPTTPAVPKGDAVQIPAPHPAAPGGQ